MGGKKSSKSSNVTRRAVLAGAAATLATTPALAQSAQQDFEKGREIFTNGTTWAENLEAQQLLQQALSLDSSLASARAYLAHSYIREWRHNWWAVSEQDSLDKAIQGAKEAVALDDNNADAHCVTGIVHLVLGEFPEATKEYDRALTLNNGLDADIVAEAGFAQIYMGEKEAGIAKIEQAAAAKPGHPWWYESILGWAYYQTARYDDAVTVIKGLKKEVNDVRMILAASYARLGQTVEAEEAMKLFLKNEDWTIADELGAQFGSADEEKHWLDGLRMAGMPEGSGKTVQPPP